MPNFVVSSLPAYVQENRDLLLKNFGLVGTATRQRIAIQTGIKKSAYINYLDVQPTLQSGEGCGFTASGTATLTQRTIEVARIKVNLDICPDTLVGKYAEYLVRINAKPGDLPFEQYVIDGIIAEINKKIENLIWQGDTGYSGGDLRFFDGIIAQLNETHDVDIPSGASAYEGILKVYMALPEEVLERGATIFVGPSIFRTFMQEMVVKNYFHYAPGNENLEEFLLPGTSCKVVNTPGLANGQGTISFIVGTFADNLVYGTDMENDWEDIKVWFSDDDDVYKLSAKWASGVAIRFPEYIKYGTLLSRPSNQ